MSKVKTTTQNSKLRDQAYKPAEIEAKWQKRWEEAGLYRSDLNPPAPVPSGTGPAGGPNKYYVLAEFSYPSGDLHLGHWFTFGGADIFARFNWMLSSFVSVIGQASLHRFL